jgi:flavin-dependent dehydrogenase
MYDIAIIGLGPAGSTLARLLDRRFSVVAIDKKMPDVDSFQKPCGGLLAPDAQKALSRFDLALPKDVLVDPQIFAVRTIDMPSGHTRYYQRFYINLNRHRFDLWLRSLIPPHVTVYDGSTLTRIEKAGEGYRIVITRGGMEQHIEARYLVGADGAHSMVRRFLYPHKRIRQYVSIQQWFHDTHRKPFFSCVFDPDITDCYSWSVSKDGYFIFGGAYPKKQCRRLFEEQKQRLQGMGFSFGTPLKTESCLVLRPSKPNDFCTGEQSAFLIGEAGGFISPSSLEGISGAIHTAYLLSGVLNGGHADPCAAYRRKTWPLRMKLCLKVLKSPFMYWPPLRRLVMASGLRSIDMAGEGTDA